MIRGKYAATVEIDFEIDENAHRLRPFDEMRHAVQYQLTPNVKRYFDSEISGIGTVKVTQQYADLYKAEEVGGETMSDNHIKSADLCERCKYSEELCESLKSCDNCKQRSVHPAGMPLCKCAGIRTGTPCPDFEEAEP